MSTSKRVSNHTKFMQLLEEAIVKNTCPPREGEIFYQTKKLRVSGDLEGNSQLGTLLFVGVSETFNIKRTDVVDYLGIEPEEYDYKVREYISELGSNPVPIRLYNKSRLILNYINIYAKDRGLLIRG